jgi:hypothetical protein
VPAATEPAATEALPTEPAPTEPPTVVPTEAATAAGPGGLPNEAILILEPGPGSRVTSPVRVSGIADPVFEQSLGVRILLEDGSALAVGPAQIEAGLGERGPFTVDVPFNIEGERQGFIQVFSVSARDGGILHLNAVGVTLAGTGESQIRTVEPHPERIVIFEPRLNAEISGGTVHVDGFGLASFEQTLLVEVLDEEGAVVGSQAITVQAPELGQPGPFVADVPYSVTGSGPGRLVVRDLSPAFIGDVHQSSVEVNLAP